MKKVLFLLSVGMVFAFANNDKISACTETKINETASIFSCPNGDYKAIYDLGHRSERLRDTKVTIEPLNTKPDSKQK